MELVLETNHVFCQNFLCKDGLTVNIDVCVASMPRINLIRLIASAGDLRTVCYTVPGMSFA